MRLVLPGDWRWRSKWWLPTAVLLAALQIVRLVVGIHSWGDAAAILMTLAVIACLAGLGQWAISRRVARRIAILTLGRDVAQCWRVSDGTFTRYLTTDPDSVALLTRRGHIVKSWRRDQVRRAAVVKVRNGFPSRPGLQIDFGHHQLHERLEVVFLRGLGLWSSREDAIEAQRILQIHPARKH